jgi:hypothetical protein
MMCYFARGNQCDDVAQATDTALTERLTVVVLLKRFKEGLYLIPNANEGPQFSGNFERLGQEE